MAQVPSGNQSSEAVGENSVDTRNNIPHHEGNENRLRILERALITLGPAVLTLVEKEAVRTDYLEMIHKHQPPKYEGQLDPEKLEEWIGTFDTLLAMTRCPNEKKVEVAAHYLKKVAAYWWKERRQGLARGYNWEEFKEDLRKQFYPINFRKTKYEEFLTLQQGEATTQEYYARFVNILYFVSNSTPTGQEEALRFKAGLNDHIRGALAGEQFSNLQEVYDRAVSIEGIRREKRPAKDPSVPEFGQSSGKKAKLQPNNGQKSTQEVNLPQRNPKREWQDIPRPCLGCGKRHLTRRCPSSNECYRCGRVGHLSKDCHTDHSRIEIRNDLKRAARQDACLEGNRNWLG